MAAVRAMFEEEGISRFDASDYAQHLADGSRFIVGEYKEVLNKETGETVLVRIQLYIHSLLLTLSALDSTRGSSTAPTSA